MQPSSAGSFSITPSVRKEIIKIIDARIAEAHVTKEDFSELKSIVKELATEQKQTAAAVKELTVAQKKTDATVQALTVAQKKTDATVQELVVAQKKTDATVQELAVAQKKTDATVQELVVAQKELTASQQEMQKAITTLAQGLNETRHEVGGLSRSISYAFENETYRFLPSILHEKYGLKVQEKIVRAEIGGKEINLFCRAERNGKKILIVGESKLRLDENRMMKKTNVFDELKEKVEAVRSQYPDEEIAQVLVTHFATPAFLRKAQERDVIVVQSFEW